MISPKALNEGIRGNGTLLRRMVPLLGNRAKRFVDFLYHYLSSFSMGTLCEIAQGSHVAFLSMKWSEGNDATSSHFAVLPNCVPGPFVFCAVFQLLGGLHIRCVVVACFAEAVSNWTVIQFSMQGYPDDITKKQKKDHDVTRTITGNVPCGRPNRNPSNIMYILAFLNVRSQCNIRGAESQCSAGDETQSLQSVHF